MSQMIKTSKEMIRINQEKNRLEYSNNDGRTWNSRCTNTFYGTFESLLLYNEEILAITSKGIYYSKNDGRTWNSRCTSSSYGTFESLQDNGKELLATTSKGLYYSKNDGRTWNRRS